VNRLDGHLLTPAGWHRGHLRWHTDTLLEVAGEPVDEATVRADPTRPVLLPGFVDLHVHGGGGADVMDGGDAVHRLAALHARHGTTALLATTTTAPLDVLTAALQALAPACAQRAPGGARVLGVHLEGPYLDPGRLGAQPPYPQRPDLPTLQMLMRQAPVRVLTLAPELDGALALIPTLVEWGVRVQIGHSSASYEQACAALQAGAGGFTHLFNAMGGLHHRAPGVAGAALAHAQYAELIPDLVHVHPGAMRAALRAVPGLFAVTDATAAAGMPDGDYRLGGQVVWRCRDAVRLPDGTLAGSVLTMDQALRNLVGLGLSLAEAAACVSTRAARYLGESRCGRLAPGAHADVVALDATTLTVQGVWVEGERIV
jgi:N-acetylglucosamine-6-phosphate deacetylase